MREHPHQSTLIEPLNAAQKMTVVSVFIGVAFSIGTLLWTVFGVQRDVTDLKNASSGHEVRISANEERGRTTTRIAEEASRRADDLAQKVTQMDERGTAASQKGIYQESDFSHATARKVEVLEKTLSEMSPKLERIDVNLQWMMHQKEDMKAKRP